jgi:hypothetical protein
VREFCSATVLMVQELRELNRAFFNEITAWWQTHVHYGALRPLPRDLLHALWPGPAQEYTRNWLAGQPERRSDDCRGSSAALTATREKSSRGSRS